MFIVRITQNMNTLSIQNVLQYYYVKAGGRDQLKPDGTR